MKPKFTHFAYEHRKQIEALLRAKVSKSEISRIVGCCLSTLYNEIKRGTVKQYGEDFVVIYRYFADTAQKRYDYGQSQKGAPCKILDDDFFDVIEQKVIAEKYSPYAALQACGYSEHISLSTLYNYIRRKCFKRLRLVHCPAHCSYRKRHLKVRIPKQPRGRSIETRDITRDQSGHWEMDTVIGKREKSPCLLVLTERNTRFEIVRKITSKTERAVCAALDEIEREYKTKFPQMFKTITCDNGCEFLDMHGIEKSCRRKGIRTTVYYCHPYSSYERGSNENANKLIRRFIPKGKDISDFTHKEIARIADWINDYPRKIHGGKTAKEMFLKNFSEFF